MPRSGEDLPGALLSRIEIGATLQGVVRLQLGQGRAQASEPGALRWVEQARAELAEYFAGERKSFSVPVNLAGVPAFRRQVLEAARAIPYGEVRTYQWIATAIGRPNAARAVGRALGSNPVPLLVPCHRVISSDGGLAGYAWGPEVKAGLLALERAF